MPDPPGDRLRPDCPLVDAYGAGVNSTALLVGFARRGVTSVKGLGRSFAWADYLAAADRLPLFPAPAGPPPTSRKESR